LRDGAFENLGGTGGTYACCAGTRQGQSLLVGYVENGAIVEHLKGVGLALVGNFNGMAGCHGADQKWMDWI
jgi:hypothetical protein